ncbi:von Willebrand factor A domain-containing protein 5A-like isoform X2 [Pyxicephalus adspersus]|uniref:von Willebrand factor A domain-containing protein 5A-like isoform X2 n=1 Tax=Pyxicephalus adspersus TaxID=30357 RepID=UPI003B5CAE22
MGGNKSKLSCCVRQPSQESRTRTPYYGLVIVSSNQPVPLQGIWVDVQVKGFVADISVTLKYKNKKKAVEAVFIFPNENSVIYSFEVAIEGRNIIAELQAKKKVYTIYYEAIRRCEQVNYLEVNESSANIFSVGILPPGQEAEVTLKYVQELPVEADGAVCFVLPAFLNPAYILKGHMTPRCPKKLIDKIPYMLSVSAQFQSACGIAKIKSNCDITPLEYTDSDKTCAKVSLEEGQKFHQDVKILAYYTEVNKSNISVEAGLTDSDLESGAVLTGSFMAESVAMLNFYPSFPAAMEESSRIEFIFLVDRSASMQCTIPTEPNHPCRIQRAKETLLFLLKSLPLGSYFNVFGFGSRFESFFPESVEYTQCSMEEAVNKVSEMDASFGGTELLEPLKKIYGTARKNGHSRLLFVITDGEVQNTKEVIEEVQKNSLYHRCFTFGIATKGFTPFVKGMADAGNGTFELISDTERMQPKVVQTLKLSLQPMARNVSLTWMLPPGMEPIVLSSLPTMVFKGQRLIVYVQLKGKVDSDAEGEVCLQYEFQDKIVRNNLHFPLNVQRTERPIIHRLAAKALISELEQGTKSDSEEVKKKILETSLQSGVVSSLTTFVAVYKDTKTPVEGPAYSDDLGSDVMYSNTVRKPHPHFGHSLHSNPHYHHHSYAIHGHLYDGPEAVWLISLQNADGSWNLTHKFSTNLGISERDIKARNPNKVLCQGFASG